MLKTEFAENYIEKSLRPIFKQFIFNDFSGVIYSIKFHKSLILINGNGCQYFYKVTKYK